MNENTRINWVFSRVKDSGWQTRNVQGKRAVLRTYEVMRSDQLPVRVAICCGEKDPKELRVRLERGAKCMLLSYDGCDCTLSAQCMTHVLANEKGMIECFVKAAEKLKEYTGETVRAFVLANFR